MLDDPNNPEDIPVIVERVDRSVNWNFLIAVIVLVIVVINWPLMVEYVSTQIDADKSSEVSRERDKQQARSTAEDFAGFKKILDTALRYDREGKRVLAAALFRQLLSEAARNPGYNKETAALLPRAADFFSKGSEIPAEQVEILYQDAYLAIKKVHGPNYYDYENVHRGLEKHYLSLDRFREAAVQTRMLAEFYRRYHKDNEDAQFALLQPTTIRLGHNLLAARQHADARKVYQAALLMTRKRGQPVSVIEGFIRQTYEDKNAGAAASTEPVKTPAGMGTDIPVIITAPVSSVPDLKKAIRSLSLDGIHIEELVDKENGITINGYADNPGTVGKFMRLLQQEIGEPTLNWVKSVTRNQKTVSGFSMRLKK